MELPFEVPQTRIESNPDEFVDAVFARLESDFLVLPKGEGFVEYAVFTKGYEALKQATSGFHTFDSRNVRRAVLETPIALVVLRTILGFTPPEWAYIASNRSGVQISQGYVRSLDRRVRTTPDVPIRKTSETEKRIEALIVEACKLITEGAPSVESKGIHRLDKADTKTGVSGVETAAAIGMPYSMLLYERFLGRPFAGHRDSVSELIGDRLETPIEQVLSAAGISFRKTKRAERVVGFDQTPDFIVPDEFNPHVVIEAKVTEDDGTARDKVTRIQHLAEQSMQGQPKGTPKYEVVACIAGRGFGVRREDMKKMLLATRGKVFTLRDIDRLIDCTRLKEFKSRDRSK